MQWISFVEKAKELLEWNDFTTMASVENSLEGEALHWFHTGVRNIKRKTLCAIEFKQTKN